MRPDIEALFQAADIQPSTFLNAPARSEAIQLSIATSLKRIADNLDLGVPGDRY